MWQKHPASKASAPGDILGRLVLNNTKRICEWHSCELPLIKNDFFFFREKLLPRLRGDLSNPVIIELIREKHHG